jgi:hypothetical protein
MEYEKWYEKIAYYRAENIPEHGYPLDPKEKQMTNQEFLEQINTATHDLDRGTMQELSKIAFMTKKKSWQSAVRVADNYIIACQRGNLALQESLINAFNILLPNIYKEK